MLYGPYAFHLLIIYTVIKLLGCVLICVYLVACHKAIFFYIITRFIIITVFGVITTHIPIGATTSNNKQYSFELLRRQMDTHNICFYTEHGKTKYCICIQNNSLHEASDLLHFLTPLHVLFLICLYISSRALSKVFEHRNFVARYGRETNHICESFAPW